jgi:hypothetical protein
MSENAELNKDLIKTKRANADFKIEIDELKNKLSRETQERKD